MQYLGIVNILAGREVVKELLQGDACAACIFEELESLLSDPEKRAELEGDLAEVVERLGAGQAYEQAAAAVTAGLSDSAKSPTTAVE